MKVSECVETYCKDCQTTTCNCLANCRGMLQMASEVLIRSGHFWRSTCDMLRAAPDSLLRFALVPDLVGEVEQDLYRLGEEQVDTLKEARGLKVAQRYNALRATGVGGPGDLELYRMPLADAEGWLTKMEAAAAAGIDQAVPGWGKSAADEARATAVAAAVAEVLEKFKTDD